MVGSELTKMQIQAGRRPAAEGLTEKEAGRRLALYGKNELKKGKRKRFSAIFLEQLCNPLIYVLIAAAFISLILKEYSDAAIIFVVIFMNALVGAIQEGKAQKALEALKDLQSPLACVIRGGVRRRIQARNLVVGDIVCLEAGDRVPADMTLLEVADLRTEESALTGESEPVQKSNGDRVYLSTIVLNGRGIGVVTETGMKTELGRIAEMIDREKEEPTPLQKRLGELGTVLSILSVLLCAALFGIAVWQKRDVMQMLLTAISLAVAAVPEGLAAVVTISLALSLTRMTRVNTIIRKLPSVEMLGAVSTVCTDKTGTLTKNSMTVEMGYWDGEIRGIPGIRDIEQRSGIQGVAPPEELLRAMVLCNDAAISKEPAREAQRKRHREAGTAGKTAWAPQTSAGASQNLGDPTEIALLELGQRFGVDRHSLEAAFPRIGETPFDPKDRKMTTVHLAGGERIAYRKGAPDTLLSECSRVLCRGQEVPVTGADVRKAQEAVRILSGQAYRTLAASVKRGDRWFFLGILAMRDPVREEVPQAISALSNAGVKTVMITGDHVQTALAIGKQIGICRGERECMTGEALDKIDDEKLAGECGHIRIFARVSPAQKVRIVKALQRKGEIVAMTGDGVNDAPSLKAADIGIAMGLKGTDVARQAADMILTDDHFATIEKAMEEGRGVYENIRKSVIFLLSSNLGELLTMFVTVLAALPTPLRSSHILWINLITDSLPALALGVDPNDGEALMRNTPRKPEESLFSRGGLSCTCFYGVLIAGISLAAFVLPVAECFSVDVAAESISSGALVQSASAELQGIAHGSFMRTILNGRWILLLREALKRPEILMRCQTYAFTVLGMSQLFHAIGMRDAGTSIFRMKSRNPLMLLSVVLGFALQIAVTRIPFLVRAFATSSLTVREWALLTALASAPLIVHELFAICFSEHEKR